jgi:hypothetical protein
LKFHSILLQGVCDHKQKKLNVCVKIPNGCHNATYLRVSKLWKNLWIVELPHKNHFKKGSKDVQPYLLRTLAHPLQISLMKCFSSKATHKPQQNLFARKWRVGRVKMENTFGILKKKFKFCAN